MRTKTIWILAFFLVAAGGSFFRLWRLNDRPMHTDEAVHAEKFGALLEKGSYTYNPDEFHGPTLNYFTLISAFLRGEKEYARISETTLRIVPAVFGIGLIATPLFFLRNLNRRAVLFCSVMIAFSPAFVYYSRYYIQEMLLVFFMALFLGCTWKYCHSRKAIWLIISGIAAGLMHASKETFIFSVSAALFALVFCFFHSRTSEKRLRISHLSAAFAVMALTSMMFYSSFGTNPRGILDAVSTYGVWFHRAAGQSFHTHPWYYYLDLLTWLEFIEPISWNEDGIVALAAVGVLLVFFRRKKSDKTGLMRFLAIYTLALTIIYAVIPYKTPWCILSFLYGMALLAGIAADWLISISERIWEKICTGALILVFVVASPLTQSWILNFHYASDPINPYVYAHTSTDIYKIVEAAKEASDASWEGRQLPIRVIAAGDDYWPLPWYLRAYTQVGYWAYVDSSAWKAPVILANADLEQDLLDVLYSEPPPGQRNLYMPLLEEYVQLRPGVEWRGYVRKDLWDRMKTKEISVTQLQTQNDTNWISRPDKKRIENLLKFSHRAMNADFEVFIQETRGTYAGQAARAAFNEVDRMEGLLSRFIENSDVSRINRLMPGQETIVDPSTFECLQIAEQAWQLSDGAFDITIGDLIAAWKKGDSQLALSLQADHPSMKMLELDADRLTVRVTDDRVRLDLGGIGKGYAVDRIAQVLNEWGIDKALIHGGASSVRALKKPQGQNGWTITLTNPINQERLTQLELENEVFSCSGLQGGQHIINPFTGRSVTDRRACWIRMKENAALADALTTAGMIMSVEKIRSLPDQISDISIMLLMTPGNEETHELLKIGNWPDD